MTVEPIRPRQGHLLEHSDPIVPVPDVAPYRAVKLIASGAWHDVWLGKGPYEVNVAIKRARDPADQHRLAREAKALARVDHPAVVRLMDRAPDHGWLVFEWVRGEPIDQWAKSHSIEELMYTTIKLVDGLRHMHEHGVVHGDLKPSNVLVDEQGHPTILDLGVAVLADDPDPSFRGTLGFAAPELLRSERPTPASDLYSLGATLYYCLTGKTPFRADDPAALTYVPLVSLPVPPSTWAPEVPLLLEQAVMKLLARRPDRRPSDLLKVRKALQAVPTSRASRPILGMHEARDTLRRAVVAAADGGARVCVVYGPTGCGRGTLVEEAVEAARREGMNFLKDVSPKLALASVNGAVEPSVVRFEASDPEAVHMARRVLENQHKALVFLRGERPLPSLLALGAIHVTPPLLGRQDAVMLITALGGQAELARTWWREAGGLPAGIIGRFRAWRRRKLKERLDLAPLPAPCRRILDALIAEDFVTVSDLAARLGCGEHDVLDHCAVLFAEELVEASGDGSALRATPMARPGGELRAEDAPES